MLLIIDVQEKLLPVIDRGGSVCKRIQLLADVAAELNVPTVVTEQYPKGLGPTVGELTLPAEAPVFEKLTFSAAAQARDFAAENLPREEGHRRQVVITGIESHICVMQTALELLAESWTVFVVADAIGSRSGTDHEAALDRLRRAGVQVCTSESVAFEWCETAGTDEFRFVSKRVIQG